jgi:hypothetical protein
MQPHASSCHVLLRGIGWHGAFFDVGDRLRLTAKHRSSQAYTVSKALFPIACASAASKRDDASCISFAAGLRADLSFAIIGKRL